jgi:predicted O-methyltransferase YrrM
MADWNEGYVNDIAYTHGFYREQTPALLNFGMTLAGLDHPVLDRPFTYCELGSGQGVTSNILAAANPNGQFWATDFNPSHAAGAAQLAASGGLTNLHCLDKSFRDFLAMDTPQFDYITLHGIYSWISAENRKAIVDVIASKLRVGGVVYVSYNAQPGWAAATPLRQLLFDFSDGKDERSDKRIERALAFADKLNESKAAYFSDNPKIGPRLERMKTMPRTYLAHEYINQHWVPFYFTEVARDLAAAKLSFAASAHVGDQMDNIALPQPAQALLNEVADPVRRQQARDYVVNQQFRRDIFVKGAVTINQVQRLAALAATRIALAKPKDKVSLEVPFPVGICKLRPEVYTPILEQLTAGPKTLAELTEALAAQKIDQNAVMQAAMVLTATGDVAPALSAQEEAKRRKHTDRFNAALLERAVTGGEINYLASPVTGSGVPVGRVEMLVLLAERRKVDPVRFIWQSIAPQGVRMQVDGKRLDTEEENLTEIAKRTAEFKAERLPMLQGLGIS